MHATSLDHVRQRTGVVSLGRRAGPCRCARSEAGMWALAPDTSARHHPTTASDAMTSPSNNYHNPHHQIHLPTNQSTPSINTPSSAAFTPCLQVAEGTTRSSTSFPSSDVAAPSFFTSDVAAPPVFTSGVAAPPVPSIDSLFMYYLIHASSFPAVLSSLCASLAAALL